MKALKKTLKFIGLFTVGILTIALWAIMLGALALVERDQKEND